MRIRMDDLVAQRLSQGGAVPALTCYDFSTALGVVSAAEDAGHGVILLVTPKTAAGPGGLELIRALRGLADASSAPVVIQLDHATQFDTIVQAVDAGVDAVLADGSALPFADNVAWVQRVSALTRDRGIVIEAELGGLAGDEDVALEVAAGATTDPAAVFGFIADTGAQLLAVAVGNVHGLYVGEPRLDWPLIDDIRSRVDVPLVLHGASGLSDADLAAAASHGLGKVNINTELRTALLGDLDDNLAGYRSGGQNVIAFVDSWQRTAYEFATAAIAQLSAEHSPPSL